MNADFLSIIEDSKALNSRVFSLIRLQILSSLSAISPEWATYREFKAWLQVEDGVLYSNLNALIKSGYINSKKIRFEKKTLESYQITKEGLVEWNKVRCWLKKFLDSGGKENGL